MADDRVPVRSDVHGEDEAGLVDRGQDRRDGAALSQRPIGLHQAAAHRRVRGRRRPRPIRTRRPRPWDRSTGRSRTTPSVAPRSGHTGSGRARGWAPEDRTRAHRTPTVNATATTTGAWRARRDSNSRPLGPQPNALSTELRAHDADGVWRRGRDSNPRSRLPHLAV